MRRRAVGHEDASAAFAGRSRQSALPGMRSLGKARASATIGESLYCAADEASLVYNVKFAAVQMDASCFRGVYSLKIARSAARVGRNTAGVIACRSRGFSQKFCAHKLELAHVPSIYCQTLVQDYASCRSWCDASCTQSILRRPKRKYKNH